MKFTQEQAVESLKRELTNNGKKTLRMSERTLSKVTEALLPKLSDEEMGLPDFITAAMEILSPINDNIGKDKSDFIKSWKAEHDDTNTDEKDDPEGRKPNTDPAVEELRKEIEQLKQQRAEEENKRKLTAKKSELASKLTEKGVSDKDWLDTLLSEVNIGEDTDIDAKAESYLKLYNKTKASTGSVPPPSAGGAAGDGIPEALKRAKKLAEDKAKFAEIASK